jgi:hypothetical protein
VVSSPSSPALIFSESHRSRWVIENPSMTQNSFSRTRFLEKTWKVFFFSIETYQSNSEDLCDNYVKNYFYSVRLLASWKSFQARTPHLLAVHDYLFHMFEVKLRHERPSPPSAIRGDAPWQSEGNRRIEKVK